METPAFRSACIRMSKAKRAVRLESERCEREDRPKALTLLASLRCGLERDLTPDENDLLDALHINAPSLLSNYDAMNQLRAHWPSIFI